MAVVELKLSINGHPYPLPNWIRFAFGIGAFIYQANLRDIEGVTTHIAISLPTDSYFAELVAVGIADRIYSVPVTQSSLLDEVKGLSRGSRVIYYEGNTAKVVSVLSVEPSPVYEGEMLLYVQDGAVKRGIPERVWVERLVMLNQRYDEIRNAVTLKSPQETRVHSPLLRCQYSSVELHNATFHPRDEFYIVGDKNRIAETLAEECLWGNGYAGSIGDFLYLSDVSSTAGYSNGRLISHLSKSEIIPNISKIPVILGGATAYKRQSHKFNINPSVIVISRADRDERIYEVSSDIMMRIIQSHSEPIVDEVMEFLRAYDAEIPPGIEVVAWREHEC